jgi:hypothetical protein
MGKNLKTFRDSEKREWNITVTVGTAKAVRDLAGVNLFDLVDPDKDDGQKVFGDPIKLVDVLFALCKSQCESRKMTDEDFGAAMIGDAVLGASKALVSAIIDFFPEQKKTLLTKLTTKAGQISALMLEQANQKLDAMDPAAIVAAMNAKTSSPLATESQA